MTTDSLSYVTVRPGTLSTDGRAVPPQYLLVIASTTYTTASGAVKVLWTLSSGVGACWDVWTSDLVVPVPGTFPAPPTPNPNPNATP